MRAHWFTSEGEVNEAYMAGMATVTKSGIQDSIDGLVFMWRKCLEVEGAYVE